MIYINSRDLLLKIKTAAFVLCLLIVVAVANVIMEHRHQSIQKYQVDILTQLLRSQVALAAKHLILNEDKLALRHLANQLASQQLVADVSIYDISGKRLTSSRYAQSVDDTIGLDAPLRAVDFERQQVVSPIYDDHLVLGYVRLTFERGVVLDAAETEYRRNQQLILLMLIVSFTCGAMVMRFWIFKGEQY